MAKADNYNDWTFQLFAQYVRGNVLEVGCGVGSFTRRLIEQGKFERLLSIDLSRQAVEHCRNRFVHPAVDLQCVDVRQVRGSFDMIICMNVLEHIQDDCAALKDMHALLKPQGTLFLLVPAHRFLYTPFDHASGHYRRYNKRDIADLFARIGGSRCKLNQYYFNLVGGLGYFFVYKMLRKVPRSNATAEIGLFDRWIVPLMRNSEGRGLLFGLSLVTEATKES